MKKEVFWVVFLSFLLSKVAFTEVQVRGNLVTGLSVRVQSAPGEDPRQLALLEAQKKAFKFWVQQQGIPDEKMSFPSSLPTDAELSNMVQEVSIQKEKITKKQYLATVNVTFKPNALDRWTVKKEAVKPLEQQVVKSEVSPSLSPIPSTQIIEKILTITLHSLQDWHRLQQTLDRLPQLTSLSPLEISQKCGKLQVTWCGGEEALESSLQTAGFSVTKNLQNQTWHIEKIFENAHQSE